MATRPDLASTDRSGRAVLALVVLVTLAAFVWLVVSLASAAFG